MTTVSMLRAEHKRMVARRLDLDMTRGKPCPDQIALSQGLLDVQLPESSLPGLCNYGGDLRGLTGMRQIFADMLGVRFGDVIASGNSSLALMFHLAQLMLYRGIDGDRWSSKSKPTFLCPAPGYDRHNAICEYLGIRMLPVPLLHDGTDMQIVQDLVQDLSVVGMWTVPVYSNPTGCTYSSSVIAKLVSMETANPLFRFFWDLAYAVHPFDESPVLVADVLAAAKEWGTEDRFFVFGSLSKVTFAQSAVAAVALSQRNQDWYLKAERVRTIGPDKLTQRRHELFLSQLSGGLTGHMARHADIIRPKFKIVLDALAKQLGDEEGVTWTIPRGGYFVSVDVPDCADRVVELAKGAGVLLTPAGATFPYGVDPRNANIRLAPTFPSPYELEQAMQVFALCVKLARAER